MTSNSIPPKLRELLDRGPIADATTASAPTPDATYMVTMRDGTRLATDVYLPQPTPAPVVVIRTPYLRTLHVATFAQFLDAGFAVVAQDCRGTGDSEPNDWEYYVYEREDSYDCVEWVRDQDWCDGFIAGCGGSYNAQMQWCMAMHPAMSAIAPEVSGLGLAFRPAKKHMFFQAYARTVGKGSDKVATHFYELERQLLPQTLAGGYYNAPLEMPLPDSVVEDFPVLHGLTGEAAQRWLWEHYAGLGPAQRSAFIRKLLGKDRITLLEIEALPQLLGHRVSHDAHTLPAKDPVQTIQSLACPVLMITGWYDWSLNDAIETWQLLIRNAPADIESGCRLVIAPSGHNTPGYHEGEGRHPELKRTYRLADIPDLLVGWYRTVQSRDFSEWPKVLYYLMGANEWCQAETWPPSGTQQIELYLHADSKLCREPAIQASEPDIYCYDPGDPTPTLGGSIVSGSYPPGSIDVSEIQSRPDVLSYTSPPLEEPFDVAGPLRAKIFASSSARDTDFVVRLSDVFPDGRAIQLQNGLCRARHRRPELAPSLLEPGHIYDFEIDMWATANRFEKGHRIRVDISSADFPRFERNANLGGAQRPPMVALQRIYRDGDRRSRISLGGFRNPVFMRGP